jgi:hypothetical protein
MTVASNDDTPFRGTIMVVVSFARRGVFMAKQLNISRSIPNSMRNGTNKIVPSVHKNGEKPTIQLGGGAPMIKVGGGAPVVQVGGGAPICKHK